MHVSVGSEIWVGTAPSPAVLWRDAHDSKPLVAKAFDPKYHNIDAEAFIDDDGQAYLYWGAGLNRTNGHCFIVKLKPDMVAFAGTPKDVTPPHYAEAPFFQNARGKLYVMRDTNDREATDFNGETDPTHRYATISVRRSAGRISRDAVPLEMSNRSRTKRPLLKCLSSATSLPFWMTNRLIVNRIRTAC